jgi:hypothetical protein
MWTDALLFWAVLLWMLLLAALGFYSVRAMLRDGAPDEEASSTHTPPAEPSPPKKP